tara:strand:- start:61230 stop:62954 length:1725 start_codon:yes stop_codon:yes gene_type:complete
MCAIAAIVRKKGLLPNDKHIVENMLRMQLHRGPDGSGHKVFDHCVLGQNRLSMLDLRNLSLPTQNHNGQLTLIYNGEIYNYQELRKELEASYDFKTRSDSEVVLAAYEKWGPDCVKKFNGMFSFFIWDNKNERGFAARDPLGVKPFFYYSNKTLFTCASEASVLVQSKLMEFKINEDYLCEYLIAPYFTGSVSTPFKNVEVLLPGHTLTVSNGSLSIEKYFSYHFNPSDSVDASDWKTLLKDAVNKTLHADSEVGLFLSGGLDSTLIASLSDKKLKTWTIRYEDNKEEDYKKALIVKSEDYDFAVSASQQLGHELHDVKVTATDYPELLIKTLEKNDLISAWEQEVSQHALALAAAQHVKAVLVGDAADETHFGYPFLLGKNMVASVQNVIQFFGHVPLRKVNAVADFSDFYRSYSIESGYNWKTLPDQRFAMSKIIVDFWLRRLLHNGDTHTMAHSLEARVPFADINVLHAAQLLKPIEGPEKFHLRQVASTAVSPELAQRPKSALTKNLKAQATIHRYFVEYWKKYGETLTDIVDPDTVTSWTKRTSENLSDYDVGLEFRLLATLIWRRRFL